jgi:hypothetical protein
MSLDLYAEICKCLRIVNVPLNTVEANSRLTHTGRLLRFLIKTPMCSHSGSGNLYWNSLLSCIRYPCIMKKFCINCRM